MNLVHIVVAVAGRTRRPRLVTRPPRYSADKSGGERPLPNFKSDWREGARIGSIPSVRNTTPEEMCKCTRLAWRGAASRTVQKTWLSLLECPHRHEAIVCVYPSQQRKNPRKTGRPMASDTCFRTEKLNVSRLLSSPLVSLPKGVQYGPWTLRFGDSPAGFGHGFGCTMAKTLAFVGGQSARTLFVWCLCFNWPGTGIGIADLEGESRWKSLVLLTYYRTSHQRGCGRTRTRV